MRKTLLTIALFAMGITTGSQAAELFLGDGTTPAPVTSSGNQDWDNTSSLWLTENAGPYGLWVDGSDARILGDPDISITSAVIVSNILRSSQAGNLDFETAGSGHITVHGLIDRALSSDAQRSVTLGNTASKQFNWDGSITMGPGVNRLILDGTQTITAPSTIYANSSSNVVRLIMESVNSDLSNLAVSLNGAKLDNRVLESKISTTLGTLTGNGILTDNGTKADVIINNLAIGSDGTSTGTGSIATDGTFDSRVTLGSGTHSFDINADTDTADLFDVNLSAVSNSGTLTVTLAAGTLGTGDSFNLFNASSFTGSFSATNLPALTHPLFWDTSNLYVDGSILVSGETVTNYSGTIYLGNGTDSYTDSPATWDTTSALWGLGPNVAFTAWTNWIDGSDAVFKGNGSTRTVNLSTGLDVLVDELVWDTPAEAITFVGDGSQTITVSNEVRTILTQTARQITLRDINLSGSFTLANTSRLSIELGTAVLPGTEILALDGADVQLNGTATDFSGLSLTLGATGGSTIYNQSVLDKTLGTLEGTGEIRVETNSIALTVNNVTIGGTNNVSAITGNSLSTGNLILGGGTHQFNINPDATTADLLGIGPGSMTLGGDLIITAVTTNKVALGDTFNLLDAGSITGSFSSVVLPTNNLPAGMVWHNNLETDGTISVGTPGIAYETVNFTDFANVSTWNSLGTSTFGSITNGQGTIFTLTLTNVSDTPTDPVWLYTTAIAGIKGANGNTRLDSFDDTPGVVDTTNDEALRLELSISGTAVDSLGLKSLLLDSYAVGEIAELSDGTTSTQFLKTVASEGVVSYNDVLAGLTELTEANVGTWKLEVASRDNNNATMNTLSIDEIKFLVSYQFQSSFDLWSDSYGLTEGAEGDDDKDGVSNLAEFGLNGNPTNATDKGVYDVASVEQGGTNVLEYIHVERKDGSVDYSLVLTGNLVYGPWATNTGYVVVGSGDYDVDYNIVTNQTATDLDAKFIQLLIEEN